MSKWRHREGRQLLQGAQLVKAEDPVACLELCVLGPVLGSVHIGSGQPHNNPVRELFLPLFPEDHVSQPVSGQVGSGSSLSKASNRHKCFFKMLKTRFLDIYLLVSVYSL